MRATPDSKQSTAMPSEPGTSRYEDRRNRRDRRSDEDRRKKQEPFERPDRRSEKDRRTGERRARRRWRIPMLAKLAIVSTFLMSLFICFISFIILWEQKQQFVSQLTDFGESLVRIAGNNAADKILGEEDLVLFQLAKNLAQNEQVLYAVITDHKKIILAHSRMEHLGLAYQPPEKIMILQATGQVRKSIIRQQDEEVLYFETPVWYQNLKVGEVHLAVSQAKILKSLSDAKFFVLILTLLVIGLGILLSLGLSMYFTVPIRQLSETAKALGMGQLSHRVKTIRNDEFGDLAFAFNRMAEDLEVKEKIKDSFGRYVTPEIVDIILANPESQWMKGATVEASVLFVDIRGFTATFFIYTSFIGASKNALTWDQLKTMKADGFEVGSHSVNHADLSKKMDGEGEKEYLARVKRELLLSKQVIDDKLNQNTQYIAFPYGEFNQGLVKLCEETGYRLGFSVNAGGNPFFSDPLTLKRYQILKKDMESFTVKLRTFYPVPLK